MAESQFKFYVLRVIAGKENKVKKFIEAEMRNSDLNEYVERVVIPTEKVVTVRDGKKITKEKPYLLGYVLVEANLVGEIAHRLKQVPDVIGFLGGSEKAKDQPVPLQPAEVERILGTMDRLIEEDATAEVKFYPGDAVKVIDGPFNGFSGNVEEVSEEKKKLKVSVRIFGRKTPVELSFIQVEKDL
jgi:transcriptional antiterminator NusG